MMNPDQQSAAETAYRSYMQSTDSGDGSATDERLSTILEANGLPMNLTVEDLRALADPIKFPTADL